MEVSHQHIVKDRSNYIGAKRTNVVTASIQGVHFSIPVTIVAVDTNKLKVLSSGISTRDASFPSLHRSIRSKRDQHSKSMNMSELRLVAKFSDRGLDRPLHRARPLAAAALGLVRHSVRRSVDSHPSC